MALWLAVILTLTGSSLMNAGVVLMKKGAMDLPAERRRAIGVLHAYFVTLKGWLGLGLNILGAGMYLTALSARTAPISLLQPLATFGLVVNAVLAVLYLGERFNPSEWLGVLLLFAGILCLGISAESPPPGQAYLDRPRWLGYLGILGAVAVSVVILLLASRTQILTEMFSGVLAGTLLGAGYLDAKALTLAWREEQFSAALLAMAIMAGGLLGGFWMLLRGYYFGRALIVKSTNFVTSQLVIGVGGIFCLGEDFPHRPIAFGARIAAYVLIFGGFVTCAGFHATRSEEAG